MFFVMVARLSRHWSVNTSSKRCEKKFRSFNLILEFYSEVLNKLVRQATLSETILSLVESDSGFGSVGQLAVEFAGVEPLFF